jgi:hypothetical protein
VSDTGELWVLEIGNMLGQLQVVKVKGRDFGVRRPSRV